MYKDGCRASITGLRSRESGAAFEKLIELSCEVYKSRGIAYIEKTPEPMRPVSGADEGSVYLDFLPAVRKDVEALKRVYEELCNAIIQTDIFKSFFNDEGAGT